MKKLLGWFKGLSTKNKVILIVTIVLGTFLVVSNIVSANAERAERIANSNASLQAQLDAQSKTQEELDYDAQQQAQFIEKWGNPPEGFKWSYDGSLVPTSNAEITAEDTAYYFLRGLSILDFSTAEKYSSNSSVVNRYNNYYASGTDESYYVQFLRKVYKECIASLEVNEIVDSAVFADESRIITFTVSVLDLTDKSFWEADRDALFSTLYSYNTTETDGTKAQQYIFDYILAYYQSGVAPKRTVQIDLRLTKQSNGGWLITDDSDLDMLFSYENGTIVSDYILNSYSEWSMTQNVQ